VHLSEVFICNLGKGQGRTFSQKQLQPEGKRGCKLCSEKGGAKIDYDSKHGEREVWEKEAVPSESQKPSIERKGPEATPLGGAKKEKRKIRAGRKLNTQKLIDSHYKPINTEIPRKERGGERSALKGQRPRGEESVGGGEGHTEEKGLILLRSGQRTRKGREGGALIARKNLKSRNGGDEKEKN